MRHTLRTFLSMIFLSAALVEPLASGLYATVFGIGAGLSVATPSLAKSSSKTSGSCRIEVTTFRKSRKSSKRTFNIPAENEADCREAARLHEENFNPKHVTRVEVKSAFTAKGAPGP